MEIPTASWKGALNRIFVFSFVLITAAALTRFPAAAQTCGLHRVALQILGSGGPYAGTTSASTGYLVWLNGRSVVLIDAGGGVFLRFGEAGARFDQLQAIAISHLHPDHVSDLPALLWLTDNRRAPLPIMGPSGNEEFPDFSSFLKHLFADSESAFPILSGTVGGRNRGAPLQVTTVDVGKSEPTPILNQEQLQISALGVPHNAPALAYRITAGGSTMVFGSDQNGSNPRFVEFASGADVLVMHFALSVFASGDVTEIHATPTVVGEVAARTKVHRLILSHVTQPGPNAPSPRQWAAFSPDTVASSVREVKKHYPGSVTIARDLQCVALQ